MNTISQFFHQMPILANFIVMIIVVLIVNFVSFPIIRNLAIKLGKKDFIWTEAVLRAINMPLQILLWIIGITVVIQNLDLASQYTFIRKSLPAVLHIAAILLGMWFFLRMVSRSRKVVHIRAGQKDKTIDATASDAIGKLLQACVVILAGLMIMSALNFSISSLIAFGGVGGIAIGFAAQGLVSNFFGGLTIYASRPFSVGEYIIIPSNNVDGEVKEIGWRATKVMGFNRKPFYVPNSIFNTAVVINHSRMESRQISETIYIRLDDADKVNAIVGQTTNMLNEYPEIEHDFFAFNFDSYDRSAIKLFLYAFTVGTGYNDFMRIKEELLLKITDIIDKNGAQIALPTSNVLTPNGVELKSNYNQLDPQSAGLVDEQKK